LSLIEPAADQNLIKWQSKNGACGPWVLKDYPTSLLILVKPRRYPSHSIFASRRADR
jgi:hypothetical protein